MNFEEFKKYCLDKKGAYIDFPFDSKTLVLKVSSKMFALTDISNPIFKISLKCDPFIAISLRQQYPSVQPGYHLSKKHWNTITIDGSIPDDEIYKMLDMSYSLVFDSLTRNQKDCVKKSLVIS